VGMDGTEDTQVSLNDEVITEFRANGGVVREALGGHFKDIHLLLLHHIGRRTGKQYVTPLLYATDGDALLLVGSNGGLGPQVPTWVQNVEAAQEVRVELGDRTLAFRPTVFREGATWDRLYQILVDYWPDLLSYETRSSYTFPVVRLDPVARPPAIPEPS
jgi:deazaflavin-dependent oxidoreductase (nitroreductase family)